MTDSLRGRVAIVGAADTEVGKVPHMTPMQLCADAILRALADAGLTKDDVECTLVGNRLTVKGEKQERREEEKNTQRIEFSALGHQLNDLFTEMFSCWKAKYSDPQRAAEWEEAYGVFLEDFRVRWSRI